MRRCISQSQVLFLTGTVSSLRATSSGTSYNTPAPRSNNEAFLPSEQARMRSYVCEATADWKKSPVTKHAQEMQEKKSGFAARTTNDDGTVTGMRSLKQGWPIYGAVLFVIVTYLVVTKTEEANMARRHESIEKDIERERWRAKELGMTSRDDGFAEKYMTTLGKPNAAESAQNPMNKERKA